MSALNTPESSVCFVEQSVIAVRSGCQMTLGPLLNYYRSYLLQIANNRISREVSVKVAGSDLVQETLMLAARDFENFQGASELQFRLWLRTILLNRVIDVHRQFVKAEKRDIKREISFSVNSGHSQDFMKGVEVSLTPSQPVLEREKIRIFVTAAGNLPDDLREVIHLRIFEQLSFGQIGKKLNRSENAASKLWQRAVEKMGQELRRIDPNFNERL